MNHIFIPKAKQIKLKIAFSKITIINIRNISLSIPSFPSQFLFLAIFRNK